MNTDASELSARYEALLRCDGSDERKRESAGRLKELRRLVLLKGIPEGTNGSECGQYAAGHLRGTIWKALLGVEEVVVEDYVSLVQRGPSKDYDKIANDVYRTFSQEREYTSRVPRENLVRLLNAYVHDRGNDPGTYMQSMSVLAAPFLFVMEEPEAFKAFQVLLKERIPSYVCRYAGVYSGCSLVEECLQYLDPQLHRRLKDRELPPKLYAFPNISSLGMCVPPLSDSMRLMDVQLAYGSYLNIFFLLGRLILARDRILNGDGDKLPLTTRDMEAGLGVSSENVLRCALGFLTTIDEKLYERVAQHTGEICRLHGEGIPAELLCLQTSGTEGGSSCFVRAVSFDDEGFVKQGHL
mmetsp:Transcript_589/g.1978  ORF Transcript_589/g.1978 Transcript_589/m.1978 type:complete len:355 (+) Transcript_589:129-1193(+)|eukprot:CAMPEP_0198738280 /NCGR_PEP_ID=MMETSP1475-20131203/68293_1 /TAXON_ID= ORGANISM="Unidentified sp., Strain CCMP1999" /NCGR_SAMPLE_ID=MMETSP1475 /ASSEMBLY_ACC=CAM_ASM_001111 /LENGTH=354 /DNA_ID=CAMNT_0044502153 /DNA_START=29 /DNA_END=1093 /DNA_ORIENTATION=+